MEEKENPIGLTLQDNSDLQHSIYEPKNSMSIFALVPPSWTPHLEQAYKKHQDLLSFVDELDFKREVHKKHKIKFNATENQLRYNLWLEYDEAIRAGRKIVGPRVYGKVMSEEHFARYMLKNEVFCVYLLKRPADYAKIVNETLLYGMEKLRAILDIDEYDKKGNVIPKILELKLKIIAMMDMRKHGAPTQRSVQLTANVSQETAEVAVGMDMKAIQQRLADLEMKKKAALGISNKRDITEAEVLPALPKE